MTHIPDNPDTSEQPKKQKKTKQIPKRSHYLQFLKTNILTDPEEESVDVERSFVVIIRGIREEYTITNTTELLIGRVSLDNDTPVDVDLEPYGAGRYGVSRTHAKLTLDDRQHLYITDLDSTNGTMLAGRRIKPNTRSLIHNGDKIVFGTLVMQLYFR